MGQSIRENFRQKGSDPDKYAEGWDRIFGKKEEEPKEEKKEATYCPMCHEYYCPCVMGDEK